MTRCHFIRLACLVAWAVPAQAEIVWLNDWDSPQEMKGAASAVTVMTSEKDGFQAHRDLDGDGRYGLPGLKAERPTWGVEVISAPEGFAFTNIVPVWGPVQHHKPCSAGYKLAVSATGKFDGEEVAAQTPDSTGRSTLRLDLSLRFRRPFMLGERFHLASQTSVF